MADERKQFFDENGVEFFPGKRQREYLRRLASCRDYYSQAEQADIAQTIKSVTHCSDDAALRVAEEATERWQEGDLWNK